MTDIKKAQAALDGFKHISCETTAIEWFEKYAGNINFNKNIVKKALKAYIEREQGWRDIKSAPKDGKRILLYAKGFPCANYGHWYKHRNRFEYDGYDFANPDTQPTHWMPLPPTPKEQEATE